MRVCIKFLTGLIFIFLIPISNITQEQILFLHPSLYFLSSNDIIGKDLFICYL